MNGGTKDFATVIGNRVHAEKAELLMVFKVHYISKSLLLARAVQSCPALDRFLRTTSSQSGLLIKSLLLARAVQSCPALDRFPRTASTQRPPLLLVQEIPPPLSIPQPSPNAVSSKPKQRASGGETIYWERYTHLTRELLTWLWENPADHAILFNKRRDQSALGNARPHAHCKKAINAVIAQVIFSKDLVYGAVYVTQTERFASVVGSHLASLKAKYWQQASRFESTSEGIDPNNPAYSNLLEEVVVAEFPFWEECNHMWHGNPTYDARLFNPAPGTNKTGDFLSIMNQGGTTVTVTPSGSTATTTVTPTVAGVQVQQLTNQNNTMAGGNLEVEPFGSFTLINPQGEGTSINDFSMGGMEQGEPVDSTHTILPFNKPGHQTLSWDNCSAFQMSPYARSPPSVISTSTMTSAVSDGASQHQVESSETSQTKGKNMLTQLKVDFNEQLGELNGNSLDQWCQLAVLKTECKVVKTQAYMHDKEIAHLEAEGEKEHREAQKIHKHFMERKKLDIQYLKEEGENLHLRVQLAMLQAQPTSSLDPKSQVFNGTSSTTTTVPSLYPTLPFTAFDDLIADA
ncbi:hypothetical protein F5J12DRAFT_782444 [Pisolithus orientalis]|uniref:uncharacterized protein n=1 Tax=Pisolithus orientalis TaxID=936130 RepID=UPI0022241ACE|nr:uncharacterized protein F5J12DRAFT_782444 [Pisolithus orientalis]KAI6008244.1 hypothetical protein F5J12DRAFT_782444 [Pisolithus orientalis]